LLLADALDRQGKHEEAVAALDEACGLDPSCAWMLADLARPLLTKGQHDRALELLGKAVQYRPQDAALQFQLAEAFARAGTLDKAAGYFERAAQLYPDYAEAWARLADARTALGHLEEAKQAHRRAAEISPALGSPARDQAATLLVARIRKEHGGRPINGAPAFDGIDGQIGWWLLNEIYLDEAIDYLRREALNHPRWTARYLSFALTRRGQYTEALGPLHFLNRTNQDFLAQQIRNAERGPELEAQRKKVLGAEASFRRQPGDAPTSRTLADLYTHLLDVPKTAREKLAANDRLPEDCHLWCNLAGILLLEEETNLYRRLCERAFEEYAKKPTPDYVSTYLIARLGVMAEKLPVEATRVLEVAQQPVIPLFAAGRLHALGLACYRAGKYEEALRHLNECVKQHPEWAAQVLNYQALALACHRLGEDAEARRWRARATEWIDRTAEEVSQAAPYSWPLHPHDLLAMWLLERELARALPAAAP
jgi:tetratricopeptide (TPR) repeat protein